ncbi:hypothetical protein C1646_663819 [Rhizophagus diaphanus]|nr:hypothetical protein C1646_663819 [Rhizophagus diaphanus] [Rhizophagus sp. MUCL 43196]
MPDLNKLNLTHTYTPEELEQINKNLKVRTNFENGRLISLPQTPIEIARQLGNWNIDTCQNGVVTTSQGAFNFSTTAPKKIRAPHVALRLQILTTHLMQNNFGLHGRPFTPIFVAEVVNSTSDQILNEVDNRFKNVYFAMDLDGGDTLPGFTLNISIIEKIVSQDCDEIEDKCPYCDSHFTQVFAILEHIARVHIVVK